MNCIRPWNFMETSKFYALWLNWRIHSASWLLEKHFPQFHWRLFTRIILMHSYFHFLDERINKIWIFFLNETWSQLKEYVSSSISLACRNGFILKCACLFKRSTMNINKYSKIKFFWFCNKYSFSVVLIVLNHIKSCQFCEIV